MYTQEEEFCGFEKTTAKKSAHINTVLSAVIFNAEAQLKAFSSTPKGKRHQSGMEMSFTKLCEVAMKTEPNLHIMDYDSGYISHNQESNSDSSQDSLCVGNEVNFFTKPIYLCEDALLERPDINIKNFDISAEIEKEDFEETHRLFNLSIDEDIINPSVPSVRTDFSGFSNESKEVVSVEIPVADPIEIFESKQITDASDNCCVNPIEDTDQCNQVINVAENEHTQDIEHNPVVESYYENTYDSSCNVSYSQDNSKSQNVFVSLSNDETTITTLESNFNTQEVSVESMDCTSSSTVLSKTPVKIFQNKVDPSYSPDLFDEEPILLPAPVKEEPIPSDFIAEEKFIIKKDCRLLKRIQTGLSGVLPPPSVTTLNLTVDDILNKLEENKEYFWTNNPSDIKSKHNTSDEGDCGNSKSLLVTVESHTEENCKEWPHIMEERYHGFHFNRSKISEEIELLCDKYGQRCVGSETQSSCTVFECLHPSPSKRKTQKNRWSAKSPGRRLSHLARRRITFSSASLHVGGPSMAGMRARQIMVDAKKQNKRSSPAKSPRKTPKKTPSKSPRIKSRTPSSSAKKKLAMRFRILSGEFENNLPSTSSENLVVNSKRALFQSPTKSGKNMFLPSTSGISFQNDIKKGPPKRALFASPSKISPRKRSPLKNSPFKNSPSKLALDKKRKRMDSGEGNVSKLPRSLSMDMKPSESEMCKTLISRSKSEMNVMKGPQAELSEIHKKKLQWAVYEALRSQNITPTHAQFKIFASILARVTRRFFSSGNAGRSEGSTSERMLRIARHHVYAVIKGKSVDEIISEYLKNRSKLHKPQGYVGIEEFNRLQQNLTTMINKENVILERLKTDSSVEKKKWEQTEKMKPLGDNRVERIRKVINFGDDDVRWKDKK